MEQAHRNLVSLVRELSRPVSPVRPELPDAFERLLSHPLPRPARAILFDVYGTLFVSSSGDIGNADPDQQVTAMAAALRRSMPRTDLNPADAVRRLRAEIDREHEEGRRQGRPYPEVDIRRTWASVLRRRSRPVDSRLVDNVALCFELESNPVWPMPDTDDLLRAIAGRMPLGIVSNAQFYTELLFEAILGESLTDLGFDSRLLAFSYVVRRAKPDPALFAGPLAALAEQGIDSSEVTYVGNDMLNDVATARSAGCMTILYAGDTRSLRLRHDDARVQVMPDSVVRSLREIVPLALAREEHR